jgi:hypothetical protein
MEKVVEYRYPKPEKAGSLKIIQDPTSQIIAYFFNRDEIKYVESERHSKNSCIYLLIDNSDEDKKIYVGQSIEGINRIKDHQRKKDFWTSCFLFTTDNNSFSKNYIDYLEHYFINKFIKNTEFIVENSQARGNELLVKQNVSAVAEVFASHIEFLLSAEGINTERLVKKSSMKTYKARGQFNASIYLDGDYFVLVKGSILNRPKENTLQWKDGIHYDRFTKLIDKYIEEGKISEVDGTLITQYDIPFKSPSKPASMVSGSNENGWFFFMGLNELRNK